MNEKKINSGFRVTPDRQEELKISAAKRRQSVQAMIEDALELMLAPDARPAITSTKVHPMQEKLAYILQSGHKDVIKRVAKRIKLAYDQIQEDEQATLQVPVDHAKKVASSPGTEGGHPGKSDGIQSRRKTGS